MYPSLKHVLSGLFLLAFASSTTTSSAQLCGPVVQDFNNTGGSTANFSGQFSFLDESGNGCLVKKNVISAALYTVTSPTFKLPNTASSVGFGFVLGGTEKVTRAEAAVSYVSTITNQVETIFLDQFIPTYSTTADGKLQAQVCGVGNFENLPGFPIGGAYRLRFELSTSTGAGLSDQLISIDNFRTNGTFSLITLPVSFLKVEAQKTGADVQLSWKVAGEESLTRYDVERSDDGRSFTAIGSVNSSGKISYSYTDVNRSSNAVYRIKSIENGGKVTYSAAVRVVGLQKEQALKAYPQPAQQNLTVQHNAVVEKTVITVSSADGKEVRRTVLAAGSQQTTIDMSGLKSGLYLLRLNSEDGTVQTLKVIKQ